MVQSDMTHGLWAATAKGKPQLDVLKGDHKTEIAIIGGGYTGLSAALHLAKAGKDAILLEASDVGFGGSGRNVGLVNAGLWLMPEDVVRLVGAEHGNTLIDVLGKSPDLVYGIVDEYDIECEAWRYGTLHCADSRAGLKNLKQREEQWQKRGAPVRLLSRDEAARKMGTNTFLGALLDERAGTIQPLGYAYGLARAARQEGAQMYKESPVMGISKENGKYKLKTPGGTVTAEKVIVATLGYPMGAFDEHRKNLVPFNYFQFATKPLSKNVLETILPDRNGIWDTNLILTSYRLDAAGRLVIGSVGNIEGFAMGLNKAWAQRSIAHAFPQIGKVDFEFGWYGRIAMTEDHIPRFHVLDDNMTMVTCYNGRGIGPGSVFGKLLAQYMSGGSVADIPLPVSEVKGVSMQFLRGLFYEAGSRIYHFTQRRI
ncbi:MAG: FAD-binding oxidoreductase [Desulfobacterales bacterium]|nr:FAD-binding oxidoreductase [Desulfobacterales bacterium]